MQDVRQSPLFAQYMKNIGWQVERVGKWYAYIKQFPLIGSFVKIPRLQPPVPFKQIETVVKKYRAFRVVVELDCWDKELRKFRFTDGNSPYSPSKTIHIDLTPSVEEIFNRFNEAKRRGVRRAVKNGVVVKQSNNIDQFIHLKQKQDLLFGLLIRKDLKALWQAFALKNAVLMLAYKISHQESEIGNHGKNELIAGVLILFYDHIAYYWQAAASKEGKTCFAPTLLVWESLKLAKKKGCKIFDFEGIFDERFSEATKNWKGFTRFKKGFGGKEIVYPKPLVKTKLFTFLV